MTSIRRGNGGTITYQNGVSALTSGMSIELDATDNYIGIVVSDIAANEIGTLATSGVYEMDKNSASDVFAQGDPVDITVSSGAETVAAGAGGAHVVQKASANGDATVWVEINVH